ncbi:MAG TPA: PTS sugar transporter subunit IIA [Pirellulales bacterium]|jgi:PTS system nitrogen regulatory IIA component|nr:PTS sugar transporter subunit IIA [Pirellulales bacterium]
MADNDFGVDELAEYLHMTSAQIARMAERGQLPGRKAAGRWRFSQAEIHHWLEDRIGASDALELARMEDMFGNEAAPNDEPAESQQIAALLPVAAIESSLAARTRNSAITAMVGVAERTGWLWDAERLAEAIRSREELYPTALDNGVALLHPRRPMPAIVARPFVALGRTGHGIVFGNRRGALTDLFFLLCSTTDRGHLHTLARLSRLIADDDFLAELRAAADATAIHELIASREQELLS